MTVFKPISCEKSGAELLGPERRRRRHSEAHPAIRLWTMQGGRPARFPEVLRCEAIVLRQA